MSWQILTGDCRDVLPTLPAQSVHTVCTSPPYFGLRDYGHDGQIGLEPTPDEFVAALVGVFREVRRVLRDDGTVWLNLGDTYADNANGRLTPAGREGRGHSRAQITPPKRGLTAGLKPKDLTGIPWMVAFALRADGWFLRSEIIWHKPNPMPESVTDRPTKAHEQVFLLSKGPRYFYDADAIREAITSESSIARNCSTPRTVVSERKAADASVSYDVPKFSAPETEAGRNRRSVWTVATQPYAGAHFATFPPKLIEPCILAGCPERCCSECGAPWERVVERDAGQPHTHGEQAWTSGSGTLQRDNPGGGVANLSGPSRTVGSEPSCDHDATTMAGTVLDPFAGAGTTGMVALRHGRSFVGIELNAEYAALARERIIADCPLHNTGLEAA